MKREVGSYDEDNAGAAGFVIDRTRGKGKR